MDVQAGLRLYCYKSPRTGFCSRGPIAIHERLENTGKYDNPDIIVICAVSSKHLQCVCRHTKSYPAGDCFLIIRPDIRK